MRFRYILLARMWVKTTDCWREELLGFWMVHGKASVMGMLKVFPLGLTLARQKEQLGNERGKLWALWSVGLSGPSME